MTAAGQRHYAFELDNDEISSDSDSDNEATFPEPAPAKHLKTEHEGGEG